MALQDRIQADLRTAMKARDAARTSALRMAIAALKNAAVAAKLGPQGALDDDAVEQVLASEAKKRREAADAFRAGGREEQARKEEFEAELYATYLPEPLTDDEVEALIEAAITEVGAQGPQAMGQVMKAVMPRVQGRADGSRVSALVKAKLTT